MQQSAPSDTELVHSLESALRMLNKRVYNPTLRQLRSTYRGLDKGSFPVLIVLQDSGQARLSELAAVLELDLSTVSRHVSHFQRLGLIARTPDADDGRAFQLSLTEEGHATVNSVRTAPFWPTGPRPTARNCRAY
jgi:DNA-binding MarR family transcriptional regulator